MEEPTWLTRTMIEAMHADQVREHGGRLGLRDEALLESALVRPPQRWSDEPDSDLPELAASYGFGLATAHPFVDGNKRIGFVAMNVFLVLSGHEIEAPEEDVVRTLSRVADGSLDEAGLAAWLRAVVVPSGR